MWRDQLEKVTQLYFLASYYQDRDRHRYEDYVNRYHHHLKQYVTSYEKSGTHKVASQERTERTQIRLLHTSQGASKEPLDVYMDGKFITKLHYLKPNRYTSIPAGSRKISIYNTKQKRSPIFEEEIVIDQGKDYLLVVTDKGRLTHEGVQLLCYEESASQPREKSKIHFIHLSPDASAFDLAVQKQGIIFHDIGYKENSSYEDVEPGRLNLQVSEVGGGESIAALSLDAEEQHTYTLLVAGSAKNLQWMLLDKK